MKPMVCVDFDGVLNTYNGWKGVDELYFPRDGSKLFLEELSKKYTVTIFTTRDTVKVRDWMKKYDMYYDNITNVKKGAVCYIDDRGLKFNGNYHETLQELSEFHAWWEE